ncbi:MAG: ABC transporter substrate-binding protein [Bacteroidales bacterium]|nr:ABC transporter substrate-binding protein [Bacteroidales bacterium]
MKKRTRIISATVCVLMVATVFPFAACSGSKKTSIVIMSEELNGLFNPFYATTGADQEVVGMTQIGMLSTDENGEIVCGEDEPVVVLDYEVKSPGDAGYDGENSIYRFVIKNDLYFADGTPLTMNDVMFNLYEYLDPVYTGSSTMYSTEIVGLSNYRTQTRYSDENTTDDLSEEAQAYAKARINELVLIFHDKYYGSTGSQSYEADETEMKARIAEWTATEDYKKATGTETDEAAREKLLEDYALTQKTFREELETDWISAQEAFDTTTAPYNSNESLKEAIEDPNTGSAFKFLLYEGYVELTYATGSNGKKDTSVIEKWTNPYATSIDMTSQKAAIDKVYNDKMTYSLDEILSYWTTAATLSTEYAAEYTSIALLERSEENAIEEGKLAVPYIDGIRSLGHQRSEYDYDTGESTWVWYSDETVEVNGTTYKVARNHNADGTPSDKNTYDILEIEVKKVDPKAIYNFSFSVSPEHYYSGLKVDITNDQFGVDYASYDFQSSTIQSQKNNGVPMGAGPYKATTRSGGDETPDGRDDFWNNGLVYFKANDNFMFDVKTEYIIYQEVSSTNAIDNLKNGSIDYAVPQFTKTNYETLLEMKGIGLLDSWQLGYGYIGINAGKVPNMNVRKAIMSAMNTSLATQYYYPDTSTTIYWPMSKVSWAYPDTEVNNHDYASWVSDTVALQNITKYTQAAFDEGVGESDLKLTFTISGSSVNDHPAYQVFLHAMDLLNNSGLGWNVEVRADPQALTKLATGSLAIWAAAWGSTVDPDMYQVYHIDSTASSTYAWGYREIKQDTTTYSTEYNIIKNQLSPVIDDARTTNNQTERKAYYQTAMGYVLDLAIELPVYQRKNLYAYNTKTLGGLNENVNPYSSPLERIWEIYLK